MLTCVSDNYDDVYLFGIDRRVYLNNELVCSTQDSIVEAKNNCLDYLEKYSSLQDQFN